MCDVTDAAMDSGKNGLCAVSCVHRPSKPSASAAWAIAETFFKLDGAIAASNFIDTASKNCQSTYISIARDRQKDN